METVKFEALPGNRSKLTGHSVLQSVAARDGMVKAGRERGVNDGYERLDENPANDQWSEKARSTSN
jgi:hypothetical protein